MNNIEKYKEDYKKLRVLGKALYFGFICEHSNHPNVKKAYNTLSKEQMKQEKIICFQLIIMDGIMRAFA